MDRGDAGVKGVPSDLENLTKQVRQLDAQSQDFKAGRTPVASGEMGLRDMKIIMAINESAGGGGKRVEIR